MISFEYIKSKQSKSKSCLFVSKSSKDLSKMSHEQFYDIWVTSKAASIFSILFGVN